MLSTRNVIPHVMAGFQLFETEKANAAPQKHCFAPSTSRRPHILTPTSCCKSCYPANINPFYR